MSEQFWNAAARGLSKKKKWLKNVYDHREACKLDVIKHGWGKGSMGSREMHGVHCQMSKIKQC